MTNEQKVKYRDPEWFSFRREVIRLDGGKCVRCGSTEHLHVHHKHYVEGKAPWEYPYNDCETLCRGCHAKEHGIIPPDSGWTYIGYDDNGDCSGTCERCKTPIRYEHTIFHPNWGEMVVGCGCADKLCGTNEFSEMERELHAEVKRLEKFRENWKQNGNRFSTVSHRFPITIIEENGFFMLSIYGRNYTEQHRTLEEAQESAFHELDSQDFYKYLEDHNIPKPEAKRSKRKSAANPELRNNQMCYAIDFATNQLVHVDDVENELACNCICPACGEYLLAKHRTSRSGYSYFKHQHHVCDSGVEQSMIRLAYDILTESKQIYFPKYSRPSKTIDATEVDAKNMFYSQTPWDHLVVRYYENVEDKDDEHELWIFIVPSKESDDNIVSYAREQKIELLEIDLSALVHCESNVYTVFELKRILQDKTPNYKWRNMPRYEALAMQEEKQQEERKMRAFSLFERGEVNVKQTYKALKDTSSNLLLELDAQIADRIFKFIIHPNDKFASFYEEALVSFVLYYEHPQNRPLLYALSSIDFIDLVKRPEYHTPSCYQLFKALLYVCFQEDQCLSDEKFKELGVIIDKFQKSEKQLSVEQKIGLKECFAMYHYQQAYKSLYKGLNKSTIYWLIYKSEEPNLLDAIYSAYFGIPVVDGKKTMDEVAMLVLQQYPEFSMHFFKALQYSKKNISVELVQRISAAQDNLLEDTLDMQRTIHSLDYRVFPKCNASNKK